MIFEDCKRAGLQQPIVTDERGMVKVTFMRPDLSGHKNDPINDPIKLLSEVEKNILQVVKENPGISRINIVPIIDKSEATVKRALKSLSELGLWNIEDRTRLEDISVCDIHFDDWNF